MADQEETKSLLGDKSAKNKLVGEGFLATAAVLKCAATLVVWLAAPAYTVHNLESGMLDNWMAQIQAAQTTATEPEPGLKGLLWGAMGLGVAADLALATAMFSASSGLIARFSNRHTAAT